MAICLDSSYVTMTSSYVTMTSSYVTMTSPFVMMTPSLTMLISLSPAIDSCLSRFAGSRYAQSSTRFVSFLSLTRLDDISVSYFYGLCACLYLYLTYLYIYWVGDGTIPIFNLLCNHPSVVTCEIPRTLARPL